MVPSRASPSIHENADLMEEGGKNTTHLRKRGKKSTANELGKEVMPLTNKPLFKRLDR